MHIFISHVHILVEIYFWFGIRPGLDVSLNSDLFREFFACWIGSDWINECESIMHTQTQFPHILYVSFFQIHTQIHLLNQILSDCYWVITPGSVLLLWRGRSGKCIAIHLINKKLIRLLGWLKVWIRITHMVGFHRMWSPKSHVCGLHSSWSSGISCHLKSPWNRRQSAIYCHIFMYFQVGRDFLK